MGGSIGHIPRHFSLNFNTYLLSEASILNTENPAVRDGAPEVSFYCPAWDSSMRLTLPILASLKLLRLPT